MDIIVKQETEIFPVTLNFKHSLVALEEIVGYTIDCIDVNTGLSSLSTLIDRSYLNPSSGKKYEVIVVIKNGSDGQKHKLTVVAETNLGNFIEKDLFIEIKSKDLGTFYKQSAEEFAIPVDFANVVAKTDAIASRIVKVKRMSDGSDVTFDIIEESMVDKEKVIIGIKGGQNGESYRITVLITTNAGYKYEGSIIMRVSNK